MFILRPCHSFEPLSSGLTIGCPGASSTYLHPAPEGRLGHVNSSTARTVLTAVGVIALLIGGVFAGQGLNLIPGSFMTGDRTWLYIGLIIAVVGIILMVLGLRRSGRGRSD